MFDEEQVLYIAKQGKAKSWPYPKIFHELKDAGVMSHEVWIEEFKSIYKNGSQECVEPLPDGFHALKAANDFKEAAFQDALARRLRHETTYVEFLNDMAAAGVVSYNVDMATQTVTYTGRKEKDFFIQKVPPYTGEI
ncbi:MAG: DUF1398 family protein [Alphaproteobacteria bacterium]|nr:DUF1398 family protein [Alphaproteobacteria bacterium]